jgi:tape measure domain-containing protein
MTGVNIKVSANTQQARSEMAKLGASVKGIEKSTANMSKLFNGIAIGLGAMASLNAFTKSISRASDSIVKLENSLKVVMPAGQNVEGVLNRLRTVSEKTRSPIANVTLTFNRLAMAMNNKALTKDIVTVTENIQKAAAISGASVIEAERAIRQLGQGLTGGILRAEEYNSIIDGMPRLAKAIADGMKIPLDNLRQAMIDGLLTRDVIFGALIESTDALNKEFLLTKATIDQLTGLMGDQFARALKKLGELTGITKFIKEDIIGITGLFKFFADNADYYLSLTKLRVFLFISETRMVFFGWKDSITGMFNTVFESIKINYLDPIAESINKVVDNTKAMVAELKELVLPDFKGFNLPDFDFEKFMPKDTMDSVKESISKWLGVDENGKATASGGIRGMFAGLWNLLFGSSYWKDLWTEDGILNKDGDASRATALGAIDAWIGSIGTLFGTLFTVTKQAWKDFNNSFNLLDFDLPDELTTGAASSTTARTPLGGLFDSILQGFQDSRDSLESELRAFDLAELIKGLSGRTKDAWQSVVDAFAIELPIERAIGPAGKYGTEIIGMKRTGIGKIFENVAKMWGLDQDTALRLTESWGAALSLFINLTGRSVKKATESFFGLFKTKVKLPQGLDAGIDSPEYMDTPIGRMLDNLEAKYKDFQNRLLTDKVDVPGGGFVVVDSPIGKAVKQIDEFLKSSIKKLQLQKQKLINFAIYEDPVDAFNNPNLPEPKLNLFATTVITQFTKAKEALDGFSESFKAAFTVEEKVGPQSKFIELRLKSFSELQTDLKNIVVGLNLSPEATQIMATLGTLAEERKLTFQVLFEDVAAGGAEFAKAAIEAITTFDVEEMQGAGFLASAFIAAFGIKNAATFPIKIALIPAAVDSKAFNEILGDTAEGVGKLLRRILLPMDDGEADEDFVNNFVAGVGKTLITIKNRLKKGIFGGNGSDLLGQTLPDELTTGISISTTIEREESILDVARNLGQEFIAAFGAGAIAFTIGGMVFPGLTGKIRDALLEWANPFDDGNQIARQMKKSINSQTGEVRGFAQKRGTFIGKGIKSGVKLGLVGLGLMVASEFTKLAPSGVNQDGNSYDVPAIADLLLDAGGNAVMAAGAVGLISGPLAPWTAAFTFLGTMFAGIFMSPEMQKNISNAAAALKDEFLQTDWIQVGKDIYDFIRIGMKTGIGGFDDIQNLTDNLNELREKALNHKVKSGDGSFLGDIKEFEDRLAITFKRDGFFAAFQEAVYGIKPPWLEKMETIARSFGDEEGFGIDLKAVSIMSDEDKALQAAIIAGQGSAKDATVLNTEAVSGLSTEFRKALELGKGSSSRGTSGLFNPELFQPIEMATGGLVRGPGTETSDDIPAMLSKNEFVMNAKAVRKFGPNYLSRMNQGLKPIGLETGDRFDNLGQGPSSPDSVIRKVNDFKVEKFEKAVKELRKFLKENEGVSKELTERIQNSISFELRQNTKFGYEQAARLYNSLNDLGKASILEGLNEEQLEGLTSGSATITPPVTAAQTAGREYADGLRQGINDGLYELLTSGDLKSFGQNFLDLYTKSVMDALIGGFTTSLTDSLFGNIDGFFKGLFEKGEGFGGDEGLGGSIPGTFGFNRKKKKETAEKVKSGEIKPEDPIQKSVEFLDTIFTSLPESLSNVFNSFTGGFGDLIGSIGGGLGTLLGGAGGGVGSWLSGLAGGSGMGGGLAKLGMSFLGFSQGGIVPSTSSSIAGKDSVPAMLTPGELVVPKGKLGERDTGRGGNTQNINLSITGDISRQTKGEIYKMLPQIASGVNGINKENGFSR